MAPDDLSQKQCEPCEGKVRALNASELPALLAQIPGWNLKGKQIEREYTFADFGAAMAFLNRLAPLAESQGHHPDFTLYSYRHVRVVLWTHSVSGLTENDFILAEKISMLNA